jgi:hypothetical protein
MRTPLFALTLGGYLLLCAWVWPFTMDDAFISYRYAKHIGDGVGPLWNLADKAHPIEGYTSFLYVWLLGGIRLLTRVDVVVLGKILGPVLGLLLAGSIMRAVQRHQLRGAAAATALSCMVLPFMALNSVSGMETMLFMLWNWWCVMTCVRLLDAPAPSAAWLFVLSGLAGTFTRPEFAAAFLLMAAYVWWQRPAVRAALVKAFVLCYVLPGILVTVWRYAYYGNVVPYSFYAKQASGLSATGIGYVARFIGICALPYLVLAATGWHALRHRHRQLVTVVGLNLVVACGYFSTTKPLMGWWFRFLLPQVPLIALCAGVALAGQSAPARGLVRPARIAAIGWLLIANLAYVPVIALFVTWNKADEDRMRDLGTRLRPLARDDRWMLYYDVGSIVYESDWNTQDEVSLNTDRIWRRPPCSTQRDVVLRKSWAADIPNPCPGLYRPIADLPFATREPSDTYTMRVFVRNDVAYADELQAALRKGWPEPFRRPASWLSRYVDFFDRFVRNPN